jgi:hypothetical protein
MAVSFSSGGLLPNFHHVRGHYPDHRPEMPHEPPNLCPNRYVSDQELVS